MIETCNVFFYCTPSFSLCLPIFPFSGFFTFLGKMNNFLLQWGGGYVTPTPTIPIFLLIVWLYISYLWKLLGVFYIYIYFFTIHFLMYIDIVNLITCLNWKFKQLYFHANYCGAKWELFQAKLFKISLKKSIILSSWSTTNFCTSCHWSGVGT